MTRNDWIDLTERAAWTFAQAFLAAFVIADIGTLKPALVAGAAAVLSMLKTFIRSRLER